METSNEFSGYVLRGRSIFWTILSWCFVCGIAYMLLHPTDFKIIAFQWWAMVLGLPIFVYCAMCVSLMSFVNGPMLVIGTNGIEDRRPFGFGAIAWSDIDDASRWGEKLVIAVKPGSQVWKKTRFWLRPVALFYSTPGKIVFPLTFIRNGQEQLIDALRCFSPPERRLR